MRTTRWDFKIVSPVRIVNRAKETQPFRGVSVITDDTSCKGVQALGSPGSMKKIWGKKKSPLWVFVSPSISQTYNKLRAPFENKMRDIYFNKEVCFVSFIEVRSLSLITFLVGSMRSIQHVVAFVLVINNYHINSLHLFWDTEYMDSFKSLILGYGASSDMKGFFFNLLYQ